MRYCLTATPDGILIDGFPLAKQMHSQFSSQALRNIERAAELLKTVKPEEWENCTPHEMNNIPTLAKVNMLLALANPFYLDKYSPEQPRDDRVGETVYHTKSVNYHGHISNDPSQYLSLIHI